MKSKTFRKLASMALSVTMAAGLMTGFTQALAASTWTTDPTVPNTDVPYSYVYENYCQNGITVEAIMAFLRAEMPQYNGIDDAMLKSIATVLCEDITWYAPKTEDVAFTDVPADAWYAEAVNAMAATGLVNGKGDGKFCPDDPITVGEWCTVLMRIATYNGAYLTKNSWSGSDGVGYTHWAAPAVYVAHGCAYTGCWEKNVDELVNRGEAITGIMQLIENASDLDAAPNYVVNSSNPYANAKYTEVINNIIATNTSVANYKTWTLNDIPDHDAIMANNGSRIVAHACWADSIVQAYNWGIVHGSDTNGTFYPMANITRAEACQMLYNAGLTWRLDIEGRSSSLFDFTRP